MWTLIGPSQVKGGHAFLILSRPESTMVLQTGEEINELETSGFCTSLPTVYTGNIGSNKYIVQLCTTEVSVTRNKIFFDI